MSDILEAAHGEACKTQMFLTSWKRRLVVLIMSTAPSSTESTKNTVHYWRDARVFDTPSFPRASHVLQAFCHTCHEYAYTHCGFLSLTFIFLNFCVTMHYLWQEVSLSAFFNGWIQLHLFFTREQRISVTRNWSRHPMHHIEAVALHLLKWIKKPGLKIREQIIRNWYFKHQAPNIRFSLFWSHFLPISAKSKELCWSQT